MSNMFAMMKKAQDMQAQMQRVQAELAVSTVTGQAGGGAVRVTMNGAHELTAVTISPAALEGGDVAENTALLEDLVKVAVNQALAEANALAKSKLAPITGGLNIPGLN
jgi:nucleoid-associated protein EbfC